MKPAVNFRQLEAFRAVIECGTVTAASERLFITQPAVTRLIRDLETSIGVNLFERRTGRLVATPEAQILYEEVERSFVGLNHIMQTAADLRRLRIGRLRIAAMPALALGFLPRVIARFHRRHPSTNISLQIRSSVKVAEWLESQQMDLGFATLGQAHPAIEREIFLDAECVAILPEGHRLARKTRLVPRDFAGENFISLGPDLDERRRIDKVFADAGVERRLLIHSQLSLAICNMVAQGLGVALVEPVTAAECLGGGIVARPFSPPIAFRFTLLFPAYRARSKLAQAFADVAQDELRNNPLLKAATGT